MMMGDDYDDGVDEREMQEAFQRENGIYNNINNNNNNNNQQPL